MKKLIFVFSLLTIFYFYWYLFLKNNLHLSNNIEITIQKGETINSIGKKLSQSKLIASDKIFILYIKLFSLTNRIQAGDYIFTPNDNFYKIISKLQLGKSDLKITLIEGLRKEEIAQIISEKIDISKEKYISLAEEGFLFPDTYYFSDTYDENKIIEIQKQNFENKIIKTGISKKAEDNGLNIKDLIIIASLVEKEAKFIEDKIIVAQVIKNRLKIGMKLDIDATIQYALGYQKETKNWWKKNLTLQDLNYESKYNTYLNSGLPPQAICNPGLDSISAVANSISNSIYYYYVSDKSGKIHPAKNIIEHNINISKYIN